MVKANIKHLHRIYLSKSFPHLTCTVYLSQTNTKHPRRFKNPTIPTIRVKLSRCLFGKQESFKSNYHLPATRDHRFIGDKLVSSLLQCCKLIMCTSLLYGMGQRRGHSRRSRETQCVGRAGPAERSRVRLGSTERRAPLAPVSYRCGPAPGFYIQRRPYNQLNDCS